MKDGFIKVAAGTPDIRVADCQYNADSIITMIEQAHKNNVHLFVFPELCITGYTCNDLFFQDTLIRGAWRALEKIMAATRFSSTIAIVGLPVYANGLYNCAAVIQSGKLLGIVPKTHLPNYGEFYEKRQFVSPAPHHAPLQSHGMPQSVPFQSNLLFRCAENPAFFFAVEICEDLWVPSPPSIQYALHGATIIANLSASDELVGKDAYRRQLVSGQSARLVSAYVYADAGYGESTTDMVFGGHNIIAENGSILAETKLFENDWVISEIDVHKLCYDRRRLTTFTDQAKQQLPHFTTVPFSMPLQETNLTRFLSPYPFLPERESEQEQACETILHIQSHGLKKRMTHTGSKKAVIGVSGGLDSTLALLVVKRTMDTLNRSYQDIHAITMPAFGTTKRTKGNAERLCKRLNIPLQCIDIAEAVTLHFDDISHDASIHDATYENAQARERTQVLMDVANQVQGLVIGTGDLSELALGWATYNGDHMSMYAVNASVPKTLVRRLVQYEADRTDDPTLREILLDILDTPVSPELLPPKKGKIDQKTEDLVGPYELHDFFLYYAIRWAFSPKKILRMACHAFAGQHDAPTILYWLKTFYRRFFSQQFKRSCLPDGPKIGSVSLSPRGDWRMPSDAAVSLWLDELENLPSSSGSA